MHLSEGLAGELGDLPHLFLRGGGVGFHEFCGQLGFEVHDREGMPQNIVHVAGDAFTFAEDTEFFFNSLVFPTLVHAAPHEVSDNVERGTNIEEKEPVKGFIPR